MLDQFVVNFDLFSPLMANLLIFIALVGFGFALGKSWHLPLSVTLLLIAALMFGMVVFGALDEYWAGFAAILFALGVFIEYKKTHGISPEESA